MEYDPYKSRILAYYAGLPKTEISRMAGLSDPSVLNKYGKEDWNPTLKTLQKLSAPIPQGWKIGDEINHEGRPTGGGGG